MDFLIFLVPTRGRRSKLIAWRLTAGLAVGLSFCPISTFGQTPDPENLVSEGVSLLKSGDFENAASKFREAVRLKPDFAAAHYDLALALLRSHRESEALPELQAVVALNPDFDAAHYNLAMLLEESGHFRQAIEQFQQFRALRPEDPAALIHLAYNNFRAGYDAAGMKLAREGLEKYPDARVQAQLGVVLLENGHPREALAPLQQIHASDPDSVAVAVYLARAYVGTGNAAAAVELLQHTPSSERSWQAMQLLGLAHEKMGQPETAIEDLRHALALKPDEAGVHFNLGRLLSRATASGLQQEGRREIETAIRLSPQQSEYYEALGKWLLEKGDLQASAAVLKAGIDRMPESVNLYLLLAIAEADLHGTEAAKPLIQKAIELDPRSALGYNLLGNLYLRLGDYQHGFENYSKAAELAPQSGLYSYDVALALERMNKVRQAIPYAERAIRLQPDRSPAHYMLGKLYAKLGWNREAIGELETCVRLDPQADAAYYLLARTNMKIGAESQAEEWSRKLTEVKEARDRRVGLAAAASESGGVLDAPVPWDKLP